MEHVIFPKLNNLAPAILLYTRKLNSLYIIMLSVSISFLKLVIGTVKYLYSIFKYVSI